MYKKSAQGWLKHIDFILLDLLCFQCAYLLAFRLRHGSLNLYSFEVYKQVQIVASLLCLFAAVFMETFKDVRKRGYYREFAATIKQVVVVTVLTAFYLVTMKDAESFSRIVLFLTGCIYFLLSYCVRLGWKRILQKQAKKISLLIVSTAGEVQKMVDDLRSAKLETFHIVGVSLADDEEQKEVSGIPVIRYGAQLLEYICREWVDEVLIDSAVSEENRIELTAKLEQMGVVVHQKLAGESNAVGQKRFVEPFGGYTVMTSSINYASGGALFLKRAMDVAGGLVGCVLMGLIYIVVAPIILIESPGPIFFRQERVGRNGKKFYLLKFRSMYMDAEERKKELMAQNRVKDGMMFKLDKDPRIIGSKLLPDGTYKKGIGNFIRDWSLDEFPQFINVLKGDMSLVGTRPPTVDEWNKYELHHRARLAIKPGITGMWQTSGRSEITDFEEVVRLDTKYINEWSFGLDIKLLFKTVAVVFKKKGSM